MRLALLALAASAANASPALVLKNTGWLLDERRPWQVTL